MAGRCTSRPLRPEDLTNVRIHLHGVFVRLSHLQMYVYSTIRPYLFIGHNRHGLMRYAEYASLNQGRGMFGRHTAIKIHKEQICAQMYSESVLIKTRNNYRGVDPAMLFIRVYEKCWWVALQSCGKHLTISCCPVLIDPISNGIIYAT